MKQTEEKEKGGRKRTHLVKVYLSDEEYEKLCKDAATFKRDKSKYLRLLIDWIEPVAPPSVEVKEFTRELRRLGVSMNQIAARASAPYRLLPMIPSPSVTLPLSMEKAAVRCRGGCAAASMRLLAALTLSGSAIEAASTASISTALNSTALRWF